LKPLEDNKIIDSCMFKKQNDLGANIIVNKTVDQFIMYNKQLVFDTKWPVIIMN